MLTRRTFSTRLAALLAAPLALVGRRRVEAKTITLADVERMHKALGPAPKTAQWQANPLTRDEFARLLKDVMRRSCEYYGVEQPR